jgi:hypothetical protein
MSTSSGQFSDVQRLRLQQKLKQVDQLTAEQYKNGLFIIFVRKEAQILISKESRGSLTEANFDGKKYTYHTPSKFYKTLCL